MTRFNKFHDEEWADSQDGIRSLAAVVVGDFELALVDCPPNLHLCSWAALVGSDRIVVPLQAEDFGSQGLMPVVEAIGAVQAGPNLGLGLAGFLLTMFDKRLSVHVTYEMMLRELYGADVFAAVVPRAKDFVEAVAAHTGWFLQAEECGREGGGRCRRRTAGAGRAGRPGPRGKGGRVKAVKKLRETLGANIGESMGAGHRGVGGGRSRRRSRRLRAATRGRPASKERLDIPLDRVAPDPDQPRKEFDPKALDRLAASLRDRGQIQPIRVRWDDPTQKWVIIAGERRWRAAVLAGLTTIAAIEAQGVPTPDEVLEDQLVENCLRDDLKPIEQARAFEALMNRRGWNKGSWPSGSTWQPTISRALSLLTLPPTIQAEVDSGRVPPTIGHELAKVEEPATRRAGRRTIRGELTRDEVRHRTRRQRPQRVEYRTSRGKVTVEIAADDDQDEAPVVALREALARAESKCGPHPDAA